MVVVGIITHQRAWYSSYGQPSQRALIFFDDKVNFYSG